MPLALAAREAMTNSAKYSGSELVDVYAEVSDELRLRVRARPRRRLRPGRPSAADRRGISDSIVGRMQRAGGTAIVSSAPGDGTEVELTLSRSRRMKRRVVLVDDHHLFRSGVRAELGDAVEVVGEAASVAEAVPLIRELDPDVVLLDVHLPDGGGDVIINAVAPDRPGVRFLALSVSDAAEDVIAVIRAGARGYVTKTISGEELTRRSSALPRETPCSRRGSPGSRSTLSATASGRRRRGARRAHPARARGAAADRPRLHVQGDRRAGSTCP